MLGTVRMIELSIIKVENLVYTYEGAAEPTLRGMDLEIQEGSFVAVLGHNGSGKSTFAKHLNGILLPTSGRVLVDGMDTANEDNLLAVRNTVGMVFQNPDNQIVANVVEDDVAFGPENMGIDPKEIRRRVDDALTSVQMYEYRNHAPHLLSGGQKQRVAIAGILAMKPRCIVLDEPTAMLDPVGRGEVLDTITRLNRQEGITVILVTHHMEECIGADRLMVMSDGNVILDGSPREIFPQVETMEKAHLGVPDTTRLLYALNREGYHLPLEAISTEECAQALFAAFGHKE